MKKLLFLLFPLTALCQQGGYEMLYHENGSNRAHDIIATSDGGYLMTGFSNPTYSFFGQDVMLFKIDSLGQFEWSMNYDAGGNMDIGEKVIETLENDYVCVGWGSNPSISANSGYFLKTNANGESTQAFFTSNTSTSRFTDVIQLPDSSILVAGYTNGRPYIENIDQNGDTVFTKIFSDIIGGFEAVTCSEDGQYLYMAGHTSPSKALILKTDLFGNVIWSHIPQDFGAEKVYNILFLNEKLYVTGRIANVGEISPSEYHLRAIDATTGSTDYVKKYGNNNSYFFGSLICYNSNLIMAGTKKTGINSSAVYVIKTDLNGEIIWQREFGPPSPAITLGRGVCRGHDYGYMVCGQILQDGVPYVYVIKIDESGSTVGVHSMPIMPEVVLYPNPTRDQFTINFGDHDGEKTITVLNTAGQQVWHEQTFENTLQMNSNGTWQAGIYLIHITLAGHKLVRKVVVE